MKTITIAALLGIFVVHATAEAGKLYEVILEDIKGGPRTLSLVFEKPLPPPEVVDNLLRESLESAVKIRGDEDILATPFVGDDVMSPNQSSGHLVYVATKKKIMTMDEHRGIKKSSESRKSYHMVITEEKTLAGIKPERRWLSVSLVYPKKPERKIAYTNLLAEIRILAARALDINAYVFVGDKAKETSWKQIQDPKGGYIFCKYESATKKILRKGELLGVADE